MNLEMRVVVIIGEVKHELTVDEAKSLQAGLNRLMPLYAGQPYYYYIPSIPAWRDSPVVTWGQISSGSTIQTTAGLNSCGCECGCNIGTEQEVEPNEEDVVCLVCAEMQDKRHNEEMFDYQMSKDD